MAKKNVYPVYVGPNVQFVPGIPALPRFGIAEEEAEELIATGAFTYDKPPPEAVQPEPEGPPDGGPSDSTPEGE